MNRYNSRSQSKFSSHKSSGSRRGGSPEERSSGTGRKSRSLRDSRSERASTFTRSSRPSSRPSGRPPARAYQDTKRTSSDRDESSSSSWEGVSNWYNKIVGSDGHYYHEHVVLPGALKLLQLKPEHSVLDLGCGQGVLARVIPPVKEYLGVDISESLIEQARRQNRKENYDFITWNVSKPIHGAETTFTHATIILALQNMEYPQTALQNAANHLVEGGKLVLVLNHPCFRIPRQSGWSTDEKNKLQTRWINRYMSPMKIPINMHPGKPANRGAMRGQKSLDVDTGMTWSFHHSLQDYTEMLRKAGFVITRIEEWTSDKESEGRAAKMENRARSEFPLFMAIQAEKRIVIRY